MNSLYSIIISAVTASIITFVLTRNEPVQTIEVDANNSHIQDLEQALARTTEQLALLKSQQAALTDSINLDNVSATPATQNQPVPVPDVSNPSVDSVLHPTQYSNSPATTASNNPGVEKVIMVNPTREQNENYNILLDKLNDRVFVSRLSLSDLNQMPEMQSLPEAMKLAVMSRAIDRYNNGEVDKNTFLSIPPGAE